MNRRSILKFLSAMPFAGMLPFRYAVESAAPVVVPIKPGGVLAYAYLPLPYKGGEWPFTERMVIDEREWWVRPDVSEEELAIIRADSKTLLQRGSHDAV